MLLIPDSPYANDNIALPYGSIEGQMVYCAIMGQIDAESDTLVADLQKEEVALQNTLIFLSKLITAMSIHKFEAHDIARVKLIRDTFASHHPIADEIISRVTGITIPTHPMPIKSPIKMNF